jgi:hypothetical protein
MSLVELHPGSQGVSSSIQSSLSGALPSDRQVRSHAMPIHDWTRADAGVFHYFHLSWIDAIARRLNAGVLPDDYYAMGEQYAAGFEPDVLTLHATEPDRGNGAPAEGQGPAPGEVPRSSGDRSGGVLLAPPNARFTAETDMEFYRRKQNTVTVRHVSGDRNRLAA